MSSLISQPERLAIGLRLATVRRLAGLTQSDFAISLGIGPRSYANYERGEREPPATVFKLLWEHYGTDPIWLLSGPEDEPPKAGLRAFDTAILHKVLRSIKQHLASSRRQLDPAQEAQLTKLLYTQALEGKELQDAYVADTVELSIGAKEKF